MTPRDLEAALAAWAAERPAADPFATGLNAALAAGAPHPLDAIRASQQRVPWGAGQLEAGIAMGAALVLAHLRALTDQPAEE
ncbi:hypothetical protein M446_4155 [Methylobacterium sp. 4-46]|uniref:hypothetical protein n=1 Tax=unclassified Methylobacterium TaxID=2615210 RepID=UPI000152C465|nr:MULTISPECIES: hypothetical protein [Methylobacterium]ACA18512.1 hypothetical protein M446_4155 [Methylobacterium sp. 4-46]WFT77798.1 hypothetical protein QA634_21090 [Methylobacterium nodulans]